MVTRRGFLQGSALVAAGSWAAGSVGLSGCRQVLGTRAGEKPRKIIHLVADGMSLGTLTCADLFAQMTLGRRLHWARLQADPKAANAWMNTRSLASIVTDSSAASSSWGSGVRILNGNINLLPDETPTRTLYELLGEAGWKRGVVTTATVTHATPAGMMAHQKDRNEEWAVAGDYWKVRPELILGGGLRFFSTDEKHPVDYAAEFQKGGYRFLQTRTQLIDSPSGKPLLGLFEPGHMTYQIDRFSDEEIKRSVPSLAEMTREALRHWENEERFFLQVEGARVDHAAHASDAGAILAEKLDFDAALGHALEFQALHPDTLLVICPDHANSNMGVNGVGRGYADSLKAFEQVRNFKASHGAMLRRMGEEPTVASVAQVIEECTSLKVMPAEAEALAQIISASTQKLESPRPQLNRQLSSPINALGAVLSNYTGIGWCGNSHTSDYVALTAVGPGSERFAGWVENVDLFRHFTELAGIDFRNPQPKVPELAFLEEALERVDDYFV